MQSMMMANAAAGGMQTNPMANFGQNMMNNFNSLNNNNNNNSGQPNNSGAQNNFGSNYGNNLENITDPQVLEVINRKEAVIKEAEESAAQMDLRQAIYKLMDYAEEIRQCDFGSYNGSKRLLDEVYNAKRRLIGEVEQRKSQQNQHGFKKNYNNYDNNRYGSSSGGYNSAYKGRSEVYSLNGSPGRGENRRGSVEDRRDRRRHSKSSPKDDFWAEETHNSGGGNWDRRRSPRSDRRRDRTRSRSRSRSPHSRRR